MKTQGNNLQWSSSFLGLACLHFWGMKEFEGELISRQGRHIHWGRKQQSNTHTRGEWAWKQRPMCPTKPTVREAVGCRAGKLCCWFKHQCCQRRPSGCWKKKSEVEQQVTMKYLRRLKTFIKGKNPALRTNTERVREARSEDAETTGERTGIIRQ